jgi:polyphosphate kinase
MTRNLDYRIEAAVRITDKTIKKELFDMLNIQLKGNVKARILDNELRNEYVPNKEPEIRAQIDTYRYLKEYVEEKSNL